MKALLAVIAVALALLTACGGENGLSERERATIYAEQFFCAAGTETCGRVGRLERLSPGYWKVQTEAGAQCFLIELDRFRPALREIERFQGVGVVDCNFTL